MKKQRRISMGIAMACVIGFSFFANAQTDPTMLNDLDSFKRVWEQAKAWKPPNGIYVKWNEELYPDPQYSAADLAAMAKRIEGHPDHPEREIFETERRRRKIGKDVVTYEVWYKSPGNFRYSITDSWIRPEYDGGKKLDVDIVVTTDIKWSLIPTQLTIIDPKSVPPGRDLGNMWSGFSAYIRASVWGDLGSGLTPLESFIDGNDWKAKAGDPRYSVLVMHGIYSRDANGILADSETIIEASDAFSASIGNKTNYKNWAYNATLGRWIAQVVEKTTSDGGLVKTRNLIDIRPLADGEFALVSAIPSVDRDDPVRGTLHYKTVMDFRPNKEATTIQIGNTTQVLPIPRDQLGRPASQWLRRLGWIVAGLILTILIGMRVIRARSQ